MPSSGQPDQFTPFLNRSSSPSVEEESIGEYEKYPSLAGTAQGSGSGRRFELRGFLSKLLGWPGMVIAGQLMLQLAAWTFFAVVRTRGSIALPVTAAAWVQAHTHTVTFIATQVSTVLAACSSFLFSWAVRQSITLHMHGDGMSLSNFVSTVKLSSRSLIFDPRKRKWSTLSIILILLTGVQAAGWSALLSPLVIFIETPITGHEIDLTSPVLRGLSIQQLQSCVVDSTNLAAFVVGQTESGEAAVKGDLQYPATFTLMKQSLNISSGGILPLYFEDLPANSWFPTIPTIPSTILAEGGLPEGLSANSTVNQQGFTAAVSCQFGERPPSMTYVSDSVQDWVSGRNSGNVAAYFLSSTCPNDPGLNGVISLNSTSAYISQDNGSPSSLLMVACPADNGYTLTFQGSGLYEFMQTMVCSLTPMVTNTTVTYGEVVNVTTIPDEVVLDAGPASLSAVTTIYETLYFAQAAVTNVMGDQLRFLIPEAAGGYGDPNNVLGATEEYLRGVTEYSGSVLRACLSGTNSTFKDGVPLEASTPITGMVHTQTVGWMHVSAITFLGLLPGTLIAFLTIAIVGAAVAHHAGDTTTGERFDPSDAMYLVTAAAAGGLSNVIAGTEERQLRAAEDVRLRLENVPGRGQTLYPTVRPA
ncbi:hypothetical protein C8R46DRAFT_1351244 [Mycena filopes]|nr:hypothetical protein C8R46DRAFT_1351244 [Mycena filopes]